MASLPNNKNAWLRRLKKSSLPSFAKSIKKLSNAQSFSQSHTAGLAKIILKDPAITTSVLKLANSVHYNTTGTSVRTISRAITLLGFDTLKEIITSCLILDAFLNESSNDILKNLLAKAFHTAYQAKEIASLRGEKAIEEIFISALILNIGELSLISSLTNSSDLLNQLKANYPFVKGKEKDYIGCYYSELSLELLTYWGIAPMLNDLLSGNYVENSASRSVLVANSFTSDYELNGMEFALNIHEKSLMAYTKKTASEVRNQLRIATRLTHSCIKDYGLELKTEMSLNSSNKMQLQAINAGIETSEKEKLKSRFIDLSDPERKLLLDVVSDLTRLAQGEFDFNVAMHLVLEGLSRSAKFDKNVIALFDSSHTRLIAKYEINSTPFKLKNNFDFDLLTELPDIEKQVIKGKKIVELDEIKSLEKLKTTKNTNVFQEKSIWGPLIINNKVIGCVYASNYDKTINHSQRNVFELLLNQSKSLFSDFKNG